MTHASVFSGIGGPEVAASMLGWENLFHCEINPFGRAVLDYWYPNAESYEDITKTDFTRWQGRVDVLTGGFPCQPFSVAGQRRGAQDDRYLWPHMHRCICEVRPAWVVCENVGGILSMVEQGRVSEVASETALFGAEDTIHRYVERSTFTLERICRDLEADGYSVQPVLIPACAVGAPHRRDRVFIVGHRDDGDAAHAAQPGTEGVRQTGQDAVHRPLAAAHADGDRGRGVDEHLEPELTDGAEPERNGRKRDAAHAASEGLQAGHCRREAGETNRDASEGHGRNDSEYSDTEYCGARWRGFPTVAPIYGGGHGLPFPVDNLTVPFSHWKNESIKAYGNAIVPQVMYEIFRAIEQVERGSAE